eukprot:4964134-Prorocentrum_lima.AAC.1
MQYLPLALPPHAQLWPPLLTSQPCKDVGRRQAVGMWSAPTSDKAIAGCPVGETAWRGGHVSTAPKSWST